MISTVVQFTLAAPISLDQARETFLSTANKYAGIPGLIRKQYLLSADGKTAGGVYLWRSRSDAEAVFTKEWQEFVVGKYGSVPSIAWFETPVLVDNAAGTIVTDGD